MSKLLVVDDDEALRRLMSLELGDAYEVITTGEPDQGLALALEHRPDAILLDLRMPKYSGYELCQTFTSFSRTQTIPVVIVSGEAGALTKEHCKQLGAAGYFEKPLDFEELRGFLSRIAQKRRFTPRSEVRVRLRVGLRLCGRDGAGKPFEEMATTENVSLSGFLCVCARELAVHSVVEVFLAALPGECAGKAEIMHADSAQAPTFRYGCRFVEKRGPWVLQ